MAAHTQILCPDPAAHEHPSSSSPAKLQDSAATAALYATHPKRNTDSQRHLNPLGPDGKLSSAGAATSLKYARAQDLPSFPSVGIDTKTSGLTAATLAHTNPSNPHYPAVEMSENALKAATLGWGHQMDPLWKPEQSSAGAKAALLAHRGKALEFWQPTASKDGLQAAALATGKTDLAPKIDYGYTDDGRSRALLAARLSVRRKRSDSTPNPAFQDAGDSQAMAWRASTMATDDGLRSAAIEQSRITHAQNIPREMYTEHPDVEIEKQERAHNDALKGAALSMAKQMYAVQEVDEQGRVTLSAGKAAQQADSSKPNGTLDLRTQAMQYLTLQDAAQKLAAERLAKLDDQRETAAFRDYYGYSTKRRSRFLPNITGRNRRRASSEGGFLQHQAVGTQSSEQVQDSPQPHRRNLDIDSDDEEQARRIREKQSGFNAKLAEADKKRGDARKALMLAAERKVHAQMSQMDEKVFNDTGKMPQSMMEEWDAKARAKAAAASQIRTQHHGKVNIGGGKYMEQREVDAIAARNVQPTLDQITETAEKQRARDEEIRLERAEQRRLEEKEKARVRNSKIIEKQLKAEEKEAEKSKKRDEKAAHRQEKNAERDQRQQGKEAVGHERQHANEVESAHQSAMFRRSFDHGTDVESPKQKRSPWKKLLPGHKVEHGEDTGHTSATTEPEPTTISRAKHESIELTTGSSKFAAQNETLTGTAGPSNPAGPKPEQTPSGKDDTMRSFSGEKGVETLKPLAPHPPGNESTPETPTSPSKKRFSKIFDKLKRGKKDKSEPGSFSGGVKLSQARHSPSRTSLHAAAADDHGTALSHGRISSPSVSSLSNSDVPEHNDQDEQRGRSAVRLSQMDAEERRVAKGKDTVEDSDEGPDDFEEARDRFDEELAPPPKVLSKKTESPVRDSKFHEII